MKLQIVNDLHYNWKYVDQGADVLCIAGDFGNGIGELVRLMKTVRNIPVFFVLGNHDYYGEVHQDVVPLIRGICEDFFPNWHLLENNTHCYNDVRFVGTTLWTDCGGPANQWFVKLNIKTWPDFQHTKFRENGIIRNKIVEDLYPDYEEAIKFLKFAINEPFNGKTVVMTHFVPTPKATHPRYGNNVANHYFATDLEYLMGKDMLFCFGHTHDKYDFMIGDTRLVCNPVGYNKENTGYTGDLIIEI
jgi:predicted phosphodiesterase